MSQLYGKILRDLIEYEYSSYEEEKEEGEDEVTSELEGHVQTICIYCLKNN